MSVPQVQKELGSSLENRNCGRRGGRGVETWLWRVLAHPVRRRLRPRRARVTSYTYDAAGHLASVTDAAGRTTFFTYDSAGRILARTLPDSRVIAYSYDGTGNLLSLTPPGRPAHLFSYTPVNLEAGYFPPTPQPPLANPETLYNSDKPG